ncbi:MAG: hypothetical protein ABJC55_04575, partial [Algoriphagus sp.]
FSLSFVVKVLTKFSMTPKAFPAIPFFNLFWGLVNSQEKYLQKVIFDTNVGSGYDDVVTIAMLHVFEDGEKDRNPVHGRQHFVCFTFQES